MGIAYGRVSGCGKVCRLVLWVGVVSGCGKVCWPIYTVGGCGNLYCGWVW